MRKTILILSLIALLLIVLPVNANSSAIHFDQGDTISLQWHLHYSIEQIGLWLNQVQKSIFQADLDAGDAAFIERINSFLERISGS